MSTSDNKPKRGRPKKSTSNDWIQHVDSTSVPTLFDLKNEGIPSEVTPAATAVNESPVNESPIEATVTAKPRAPRKKKPVTPVAYPEPVNATPTIITPTTEITEPVTDDPSELGPLPVAKSVKLRRQVNWFALFFAFILVATIGGSSYFLGFVYTVPMQQPTDLTLRVPETATTLAVSHPSPSQSMDVLTDNNPSTLYTSAMIPQGEYLKFTISFDHPIALSHIVLTPRNDIFDYGLITAVRVFAQNDTEYVLLEEFTNLNQAVMTLTLEPFRSSSYELLVTKQRGSVVTLAEIALYERDVLREELDALFVNGYPRPGIDQATLNAWRVASSGHPLETEFLAEIAAAESLLLGSSGRFYSLLGRPSETSEQLRMRTIYTMNGLEPTGVYATPGETLTVIFDQLPTNTDLSICFSRFYGLHEGAYECHPITSSPANFIAPATFLGPVYFQFTGPLDARVRLEMTGGTPFPIYREGTSIARYEDELAEYQATATSLELPDPSLLGSVIPSGTTLDMTEIVSDHVVITLPASTAIASYVGRPDVDPHMTLSQWDTRLQALIDLLGFNDAVGINHTPYLRENLRAMTSSALTHVQDRFVSLNINPTLYTKVLEDPTSAYVEDLITELSSRYSLDAYNTFYDMDNAMVQLLVDYQLYQLDEPYLMQAPEILNKLFSDLYRPNLDFGTLSSVEQMAIHWQLAQYYGFEWYGEAMRTIRQNSHLLNHATLEANTSDWVYILSSVVGENLEFFFEKYNFPISNEVRLSLQDLPASPDFITYVDADYEAQAVRTIPFYHQAQINAITQVGDSYRLSIAVDATIEDQILGYFIYRDGEEIGFTSSTSYVDNSAQIGDLHRYSVRPLTRRGSLLSTSPLEPLRALWYPRDFSMMSICEGLFCTSPDLYSSMFDLNPETLWITTSDSTHTIIVEMESLQEFYGLSLVVPDDYVGPAVQQFTISTSEDGISWSEPLFTATFGAGEGDAERGIYFSNPVETQFVRLELLGYNDGVSVGELRLYVRSYNLVVLGILGGMVILVFLGYAIFLLNNYRKTHAGLPSVMPLASVVPVDATPPSTSE